MILVTGATGTAGSHVVRALLEQRRDVRVFVRDAGRARALFGDRVEIATGDFAAPASVRTALDGIGEVFLSGADDPRRVEWETGAIDAAVAAGVASIVKLSSIVAVPGAPVAFWDWHGRIERHLRGARVSSVVLRSSFFMSNLLAASDSLAREGRLYAPAGEARIAMIDPVDVGAAAAAVMCSEGHDGRSYALTGPKAVTYAEIASELAVATGRDVEFVNLSDDQALQGLVAAGLPGFVAEQIVAIFAQAREGVAEQVTTTVESLTGRPPRDIAAFARDHAPALGREVAA